MQRFSKKGKWSTGKPLPGVETDGLLIRGLLPNSLLIDGALVNGSARSIRLFSNTIRHIQSGYLYHYAFAIIIGLLLLIVIFVHKVLG